ncbi:hypothetical protein ACFVT5_06115 [Streptomyces sp. NPDC058001]|uniref:hypothetical protein n=1 Tax=Streptomyces sp. NPDC058001 TaxID=3346300 RepID=UPI0036ECFA32
MHPQQPYGPPVPPSTPPAVPPAVPSRRTGPLVAALLIGLVVGAGGVGAAWAFAGDGSGEGDAAADASAACGALDRFDESKYATDGPEGDMALNRFGAAGAHSAAAAAGDPAYKPLATAIRDAQLGHANTFKFGPEVKKDLAKARDICGDLD